MGTGLPLNLFILYQEIDLARDILQHEGNSLHPDLGKLLPVAVHPGRPGALTVLEEEESSPPRRVFLTSSPNEDFFWALGSIGFVIDVGLEKRKVNGWNQEILNSSTMLVDGRSFSPLEAAKSYALNLSREQR